MIGEKIKDAKVYGTPFVAILGDKVEEGKVELEETLTGEKQVLSIDEAVEFLNKQREK
jgi:prolyl-tRNA synthetase